MRSLVLSRMGVAHRLRDVPADGSCLYHAVVRALALRCTAQELRDAVASHMTEEDAMLLAAIHGVDAKYARDIVRSSCTWADGVEIGVLAREMPDMTLLVIDEDRGCINRYGSGGLSAILHRADEHYRVVEVSRRRDLAQLHDTMSALECLVVECTPVETRVLAIVGLTVALLASLAFVAAGTPLSIR